MPNTFAQIALFAWIPLALLGFRLFKPVTAMTIAILGSLLLLPANFEIKYPGFPAIDRHVAGGLAASIGYFLLVPVSERGRRKRPWELLVLGVLVSSSFVSAVMNPDPLVYGGVHLPALTTSDSLGLIFQRLVGIAMPFYVGSRLVKSYQDVLAVFRVIVAFGLVYVPLILWEAKMSPQLHTAVYGYFPHAWAMHLRAGGFRPVVFTGSGLECGLFMATAVIANVALYRGGGKILGLAAVVPTAVLGLGVAACLSLAPILYALGAPLLLLATRQAVQARVCLALAGVVLFYPLLRSRDLFPTSAFVEAAEAVSGDRAFSLGVRFDNEDKLLAKASERSLFGWGGWGRNRVYDPETGRDESITDGFWIIELGQFGLTGFLSFFTLLLAPIALTARHVIRMGRRATSPAILGLMLIVLVRAIDLIPNGFLAPITLFLAGALLPFSEPSAAPRPARAAIPARGAAAARRRPSAPGTGVLPG